ncbi:UNVERIFIED_CONTAM: hypothetical protein NCL1_34435 [Trichonephila clavipes]
MPRHEPVQRVASDHRPEPPRAPRILHRGEGRGRSRPARLGSEVAACRQVQPDRRLHPDQEQRGLGDRHAHNPPAGRLHACGRRPHAHAQAAAQAPRARPPDRRHPAERPHLRAAVDVLEPRPRQARDRCGEGQAAA